MRNLVRAIGTALLTLCLIAPAAHANVIISGTRVIFPAQDGEVTVRLTNQNTSPALVEAWIDNGDKDSTPDKANTPFLITPPLFRMEPNRDQSLRILFTHSQQPLPSDRESLFWLNVLDVPPKPTGPQTEGKNYLQLAIRSRLKLFYRPTGLAGDPIKAAAALTFKAGPSNAGGYTLVVHNPTPYYVTISKLTLQSSGSSYNGKTNMVAPMSDLKLDLPELKHAAAVGDAIEFDSINDYGAIDALKSSVAP
ncbi:fimbrial biogenesis chaperone [Dyella acidiphila]|uniref:Fimbria/pilus periplasmic chaperone n=1 Tax=Dyella acidiphila TaxID=2775866 RepID=A0ABR9G5P5_9GAMM|nr:fimbria/pilus periplasmic chaperone [Dyella acidiphila]MBE1159377.1 fimbria/pilus periplasmic chaperone [Dyella acidiphila]